MRKILKILLMFVILISCGFESSYAKEGINSINIDVYIDGYGDAKVTEIWDCESYSGTEWYHPYYNLGNSKISNLAVRENGKEYTLVPSWDTKDTKDYKTEKCGLNRLYDGVEICWGMGEYGSHTYEVSYTISNFVDKLNDSQMIYWTLIPHNRSDKVENAKIKIYADKYFDDNTLVWGFGENGGICRINNGYIEMQSKNGLNKSEYMTILAKLPQNFFDSNNSTNKKFDYYYDMAIKDTSLEKNDYSKGIIDSMRLFGLIIFVIFICFPPATYMASKGISKIAKKNIYFFIVICIFYFIIALLANLYFGLMTWFITGTIANFIIQEKKVIKDKINKTQIDYYRDIPCEGDIFKAYYIGYQYGIIKKETDLLGALILKWIKEHKISVVDFDIDSKKDYIQLSKEYSGWEWNNPNEKQMYQIMYEASKDGCLEKYELQEWCKDKFNKLFSWFDNVMTYEQSSLIEKGELILQKNNKKTEYIPTEKMRSEVVSICGLKKYLMDYSLISKREATEVYLFEDYLIMAQLLGIAQEVAEQFEELYPEVIEESSFNYSDYYFVRSISRRTVRTASFARTVSGSASRGGGGRSFGSGGGGSRGGGRGGGGRR